MDGSDTFSRFFQEKIDKLLVNLYRTTAVDPEPGETLCFTASIEVFEPTTTAEMSNILGIAGKMCIIDPLPTKQLSDNVESTVPSITYVTKASLEKAVMPALHCLSTQLSGHCSRSNHSTRTYSVTTVQLAI